MQVDIFIKSSDTHVCSKDHLGIVWVFVSAFRASLA